MIGAIVAGGLSAPTAPVFNSYESIMTATPTGSTFTFSVIPSDYKHLQIRSLAKMTSTAGANDDGYIIQINGDTGSNYAWHMLYGTGNGVANATGGTSQTRMYPYGLPFGGNNGFGAMITDVLDYTNTNKNTTLRFLSGYDNNGAGDVLLASGLWMNTSAVTSITISASYGNFASGSHFALYGIKG
jgi:hypothetical protein